MASNVCRIWALQASVVAGVIAVAYINNSKSKAGSSAAGALLASSVVGGFQIVKSVQFIMEEAPKKKNNSELKQGGKQQMFFLNLADMTEALFFFPSSSLFLSFFLSLFVFERPRQQHRYVTSMSGGTQLNLVITATVVAYGYIAAFRIFADGSDTLALNYDRLLFKVGLRGKPS